MALSVKAGAIQALTAGLPADIDTTVGFEPKVVLFFSNARTSAGSSNTMFLSCGAMSADAQWATSLTGADNSTSLNIGLTHQETACLRIRSTSADVVTFAKPTTPFDTDGFIVSQSVGTAASYVNYLALGGTDLTNVKVGTCLMPSSATTLNVTAGFQPDLVFLVGVAVSATNPLASTTSNIRSSIGWGTQSAQYVTTGFLDDGSDPTVTKRQQLGSYVYTASTDTTPLVQAALSSVGSWPSDGFQLTFSGTPTTNAVLFYVALKGISAKVGTFSANGSSTQSVSSVGFTPKALWLQSFGNPTSSSAEAHFRISLGAGTGASERYSLWTASSDAVATSVEDRAYSQSTILETWTETTPTNNSKADLSSLDSDGFSLAWNPVNSTSDEIVYVAFGDAGVTGQPRAVRGLRQVYGIPASSSRGKWF